MALLKTSRWSETVAYDEWLPCEDTVTLKELQHMTSCHERLVDPRYNRVPLPLTDHLRYAMNLCRMAKALRVDYPTLQSAEPLRWKHGAISCNCYYFELIRRSMDVAHRFLAEITTLEQNDQMDATAQRKRYLEYTRSLIGVLCFVRDEAFSQWTDVVQDSHAQHYTLRQLQITQDFLRAYALWSAARLQHQNLVVAADTQNTKAYTAVALLATEAHRTLQGLPTSFQLVNGGDGTQLQTLHNGSTRPFLDPPTAQKPLTLKKKGKPKQMSWCERIRLDYVIYWGCYYWTHDPSKALLLWRTAVLNGADYYHDMLSLREREDHEIYHSPAIAPEDAKEWEKTYVAQESARLDVADEAKTWFAAGCAPLPCMMKTIPKQVQSSAECKELRCGPHAFDFVFRPSVQYPTSSDLP